MCIHHSCICVYYHIVIYIYNLSLHALQKSFLTLTQVLNFRIFISLFKIRLISEPPCGRGPGAKEKMFSDGIDFCIAGKFSPKPLDKTFFEFSSTFMAGPVPLKLSFGAGGSLGVDLGAKLCILSMKVKVSKIKGVKCALNIKVKHCESYCYKAFYVLGVFLVLLAMNFNSANILDIISER